MARILILVWWLQQLWGQQPGSMGWFSISCFNESLLAWLADADIDKRRNTMLKNTQT